MYVHNDIWGFSKLAESLKIKVHSNLYVAKCSRLDQKEFSYPSLDAFCLHFILLSLLSQISLSNVEKYTIASGLGIAHLPEDILPGK